MTHKMRVRKRWLRTRAEIEAMENVIVYMSAIGREPKTRRAVRRGMLVALRWVLGQALDLPARVEDGDEDHGDLP